MTIAVDRTVAPPVRKRSRRDGDALVTALIFLPPALLLFTIFVILPIGEAAWYGFYNWNGFNWPERFIGLGNYERALGHSVFQRAAFNNVLIILVSLLVQLPLALAMAILLSEKLAGAVTFRMIFFVPFILADVAAGLIWRFIFDGDIGLYSNAVQALGGEPVYLLASRDWAMVTILVTVVWRYFGFHMMLYIAGLQNIDRNLYEAADIDGATRWQKFRYVTLPQLGPMIRLSVFFSLIGSLQLFDLIIPLTDGGPLNSTHSIVTYLYTFGIWRMKVSYGSAIGVILFVAAVIIAFGYKRILMRDD